MSQLAPISSHLQPFDCTGGRAAEVRLFRRLSRRTARRGMAAAVRDKRRTTIGTQSAQQDPQQDPQQQVRTRTMTGCCPARSCTSVAQSLSSSRPCENGGKLAL